MGSTGLAALLARLQIRQAEAIMLALS